MGRFIGLPSRKRAKYKKKKPWLRKTIKKILRFLDWRRKQKKFLFNVSIGIVLALLLHLVLFPAGWGEVGINQMFDLYKFNQRETKRWMRNTINQCEIVFIYIDPETNQISRARDPETGRKRSEKKLFTPRDQIAGAIQTATNGGAKIILPDFKFETPDYEHPQQDAELRKTLKKIAQNNQVHLILPVGVERNGELKPNLFDDLILKAANIHRALPGIVSSGANDTVIRYWREYEFYKNQGKRKILWGVPLLVTILREGRLQQLDSWQSAVFQGKSRETQLGLKDKKVIRVTTEKENPYLQRIRFTLIPRDVLKGEAAGGNLGLHINIAALDAESMPDDTFRGKIVIIGNPNPDFGDVHHTPLGKMPGMYLLGNAIHTLLEDFQVTSAPLWLDLFFDLLIILFSACFYTFIPGILSKTKILRTIDTSVLTCILGVILTLFLAKLIGYNLYLHYNLILNSVLIIFLISFIETAGQIKGLITGLAKSWEKRRQRNEEKKTGY